MELAKKTTILFSEALHKRLKRIAEQRGVSLGQLVRSACVQQYGLVSTSDQLAAVDALGALMLPVGTPAEMKQETVENPSELMP